MAQVAALQAASTEAAHWDPADYLQYRFQVSVSEGRIVGFLVVRTLVEGEAELLNLVVAADFRRQGVARRLLEPLLSTPAITVFLEVRESNAAARKLYKSMGFQEVNVRQEYYDSPLEAAIVMKFHSC